MEDLKKNSNVKEKSSKGRKKPVILIAAVSLALIVIAVSLMIFFLTNGGEEDNPPFTGDWSECGTYYSVGDRECELTLIEGGTFTLIYDGNMTSGSYTLVDGALTLDFSADGEENAVGEYSEGVVTLTYRGTTVRLIEKVSYTVQFETNGGTNMEAVTVLNGKTLQKPDDPIRENYIFVGWYKDSEYTQPFTFSADIVTSDITIYARWVENTGAREYTVSFDLGFDGSTAFEPIMDA